MSTLNLCWYVHMHSCLSLFKKWESPAGPLGQARATTGGGGSGRVVLEPNLRGYRGTAAFSSMSETSRCPFCSSSSFCYGHVLGWQEARVTEEGCIVLSLLYISNGMRRAPLLTCGLSSFPRMSRGEVHFLHQNSFIVPQEHHQEPRAFPAQQIPGLHQLR